MPYTRFSKPIVLKANQGATDALVRGGSATNLSARAGLNPADQGVRRSTVRLQSAGSQGSSPASATGSGCSASKRLSSARV